MTTHGRLSSGSTGSPPPRIGMQDQALSWTDDLPVCHLSGVGFSTNQIYREDGFRREEHEFEDRSFHFRVENDVYLYGVFDGHDGCKTSHFAAQRMPAELLLGQLTGKTEDDEIKEILHQAFIAVEKGFSDSIDDPLAEKAKLLLNVPEGMNAYEIFQQYPEVFKKLETVEAEICGGTTAVVTLIYNNKLYIANVGCSRALMCKTDAEGVLRVVQLTVDHDLNNEEELLRLSQLGLDVEKLRQHGKLGNHNFTRTIGDYNVKTGYKDIELLSGATSEPVIAEPELHVGDTLDESCSFLILMSDGLYMSLEDATGTEHVNADIAAMVAAEFSVQSTLHGVAQAVVDKVVRIHHDTFMTATDQLKQTCQKRDDITLLVRNFNYPLPNAISSPTAVIKQNPMALASSRTNGPLSVTIPTGEGSSTPPIGSYPLLFLSNNVGSSTNTTNSGSHLTVNSSLRSTMTSTYTSSNDSTQGSSSAGHQLIQARINSELVLDANGLIEPYVDFAEFYKAIDELTEAQKESLNATVEPKPAYEAIPEEKEPSGMLQSPTTEEALPLAQEQLVQQTETDAVAEDQ